MKKTYTPDEILRIRERFESLQLPAPPIPFSVMSQGINALLTPELISRILLFLPTKLAVRCSRVCKKWQLVAFGLEDLIVDSKVPAFFVPSLLSKCNRLTRLTVHDPKGATFNDAVLSSVLSSNCKGLVSVSLSVCHALIDPILSDLPSLSELKISDCWKLKSITTMGCPRLTTFEIAGLPLLGEDTLQEFLKSSEFPSLQRLAICNVERLTNLEFAHDGVTELSVVACPSLKSLTLHCSRLTRLNLCENPALTTPAIHSVITRHPSLTYVDLTGCTDLDAIEMTQETNPHLESLVVRGCTGLNEVSIHFRALKVVDLTGSSRLRRMQEFDCPNLEIFRISDCPRVTPHDFLTALLFCSDTLRELTVGNIPLQLGNGHMGFANDSQNSDQPENSGHFPILPLLETFKIKNSENLSDELLSSIINGKTMPRLGNLSISDCMGLDLPKLGHLPHLKAFSATGCPYLSGVDMKAPNLESLDVSGSTRVDSDTIQAILQHSKKIKSLKISSCPSIESFSAKSLPHVQSINAAGARLTEDCIQTLLKSCRNLKELVLAPRSPQLEAARRLSAIHKREIKFL